MKHIECARFLSLIVLLVLTLNPVNGARNSSVASVDLVLEESVIADENSTTEEPPYRIVGGQSASIQLAPWQVAIIRDRRFVCGGSVISRLWILTAAHCVTGDMVRVVVRAGTRYFKRGGQTRGVVLVVRHGNYNPTTGVSDIAMLRVSRPFTFSNSLRPVRLPSPADRLPRAFFVTGWGTISESGSLLSRGLRVATLALVSTRTCIQQYWGRAPVPPRTLCAAAPGRDSCSGDSGGALVSGGIQYGVVASGFGCARRNYAGIYMDVRAYRNWITRVARNFANIRNAMLRD